MLQTAMIMGDRFDEFERMTEIIKNKGIQAIFLKGCVVRELYPTPELRTMGDFDVFVEKATLPKIKEIFTSEDYDITTESKGIDAIKGNNLWEIFFSLEDEFRVNADIWDKSFSSNTMRTEADTLTLSPTYMLLHLMLHFDKHIAHEGAGIRSLLDIALYIKKYKSEIDFDFVRQACAKQHYENAYVLTLNAVSHFFGVQSDVENKDVELFVEYTLTSGIFGEKLKNVMISQVTKVEDNVGIIRKLFFPTVKMMEFRYTYLKKFPWLLPFAWVHRIFRARSHHGYTFGQMLSGLNDSIKISKEHETWVNGLNLYDEEKQKLP